MEKAANVNLFLHAHLPYVRHIEYSKFLEEDWLFEALNETYIPLSRILHEITTPYKLSICFSPTFATMCTDPQLQERFVSYMQSRIELGEKEVKRCEREQREALQTAIFYRDKAIENLEIYESYKRNILESYKELAESGKVELVATSATHAYLPLYRDYESAIKAQIELGIKTHIRIFGRVPKGFWLPECGYYPGIEKILERYGIRWIQLPSQSVLTARNLLKDAGSAPTLVGDSYVVGFVRDWSLTNLVWSDAYGYPCDPDYRDFYRDIGYDLPLSYISPYIHEPDVRVFTGFKYFAITGPGADKKYYDFNKSMCKVELHANNFLYHIRRRGLAFSSETGKSPIYTICFDADLFGHRWFEGLEFLKFVLSASSSTTGVTFTTPSESIANLSSIQRAYYNVCSWGNGGYSDVWLDGSNSWIYRHIHKAIERMEELSVRFSNQTSLKARFLNQAAREVLLAMASDWPYIMHNKTCVTYAEKRLRSHLGSFNVVYSNMCRNAVNTEWLIKAERRNVIFPEIDYNIFNPNN